MELSDELYSHNPSEVSCLEAKQILKDGLRSVIMSKLAFDTFKEFNTAASKDDSPENPLPDGIHELVGALLDKELTEGEVPFTKAFCKDSKIKELAKSHYLTAHGQWTFRQKRSDGRTTNPRSDIVFVRDKCCPPTADKTAMELTPVALLEVGLTNGKDSTAIDDKWFEKLGQGTRYVDLMNNDDVSGQKRKREEIEESQDSYVDSQESEKEQELSQSFGKLKMGDPILFYVIIFGNEPDEEKDVQWMKIGCFISQKKAGDHKRNTT
jgi:hypothetical protein